MPTTYTGYWSDTGRKCGNVNCQGHLTKFNTCLAEALYTMAEFDDQFGTSTERGWYGIIVEGTGSDLEHPDGFTIGLKSGVYVLHEDSLGFVYLYQSRTLEGATALVDDYIRARDEEMAA